MGPKAESAFVLLSDMTWKEKKISTYFFEGLMMHCIQRLQNFKLSTLKKRKMMIVNRIPPFCCWAINHMQRILCDLLASESSFIFFLLFDDFLLISCCAVIAWHNAKESSHIHLLNRWILKFLWIEFRSTKCFKCTVNIFVCSLFDSQNIKR